jgi:hypothetical protein
MSRLVYIGGYGHSGSTLLEYLMTASPEVVACGEVVNAWREQARERRCSCGRLAEVCPIWGPLSNGSNGSERLRHEDLDLALLEQISKDQAILVDSSKTAWRVAAAPFRLRRRIGSDFFLVHIVRDPIAVCWSLIARNKRMGTESNSALVSLSTAFGWLYANLACELVRLMYPTQYHRVRYEDLARSTREALAALMHRLLPGREWRFEAIGTSDNRHQLYGNRLRLQQLSVDDVEEDTAWEANMPSQYRRLAIPITWILRRRYGY